MKNESLENTIVSLENKLDKQYRLSRKLKEEISTIKKESDGLAKHQCEGIQFFFVKF